MKYTADTAGLSTPHEALLYHDPERVGFYSILEGDKQHSHPLDTLPVTLDNLPTDRDLWLSQGEFKRKNRRLVDLARIGLHFADLDTHRSDIAHLSPSAQATAVLLCCEDEGLPPPSVILSSGRGLYCKWPLQQPTEARDCPRWSLMQRSLVTKLRRVGADPASRDASRVLRVVGSLNSKAGRRVRVLWTDSANPTRWDGDLLAKELLPWSREEVAAYYQAQGPVEEVRALEGNVQTLRELREWRASTLWWARLNDLDLLLGLRDWRDVPAGFRDLFLFVGGCALAWSKQVTDLEGEIEGLAARITPTLTPTEIKGYTRPIVNRALMAARGETIDYDGRHVDPRYRFSTARLIELLEISPEEERHLSTLISQEEARRRERERDRLRHRKFTDRATYEASAQAKREETHRLRAEGLPCRAIAERMGLTSRQVTNLLQYGRGE